MDFEEKYKGLVGEERAEKIAADVLRSQKTVKKEEEFITWGKAQTREYAATIRKEDEFEAEEVEVGGLKVVFQRPTPNNFNEDKAKEIKDKFTEVLEDEGEKKFKELFERKVEFKPFRGFADNYFSLPKGQRRRLDKMIPWKTNTPLVKY